MVENAVKGFAQRVGVTPEGVVAVMLGLAENERRERYGALEMVKLLSECRTALYSKSARTRRRLSTRIDACLTKFTARLQ